MLDFGVRVYVNLNVNVHYIQKTCKIHSPVSLISTSFMKTLNRRGVNISLLLLHLCSSTLGLPRKLLELTYCYKNNRYHCHHFVIIQFLQKGQGNFEFFSVLVKILTTHIAITVAHQILAFVTNIRCPDFSALAEKTDNVMYTTAHTFCWLQLELLPNPWVDHGTVMIIIM